MGQGDGNTENQGSGDDREEVDDVKGTMSRPKPGREKKEEREMEEVERKRRHRERETTRVTPEKPGDAEAMKERQQLRCLRNSGRMRKGRQRPWGCALHQEA